jgi:hypothetical protein
MGTDSPSKKSPAIGLADLLFALDKLDTGVPGVAERIGLCLGFTDLDVNKETVPHGAWDPSVSSQPHYSRRGQSVNLPESVPVPTLNPPPELPSEKLNTSWTPLGTSPQQPLPPWLGQPPAIEPKQVPVPLRTLLSSNTARPVLSAALATLREGDEPDIPRLIERLCNGQAVTRLPMMPRGTLERGVDLLLDNGEGMTPFYDDLKALAEQVRDVVGHDRYRGYSFQADPGQAAGRRSGGKRSAWQPTAGRPVLVVTDFGKGTPPISRERVEMGIWRQFVQKCQRAGTPLLGLVPSHPDNWPVSLGRHFKLVHWDPRTRASTVRHLVGCGHPVAP